MDPAGPSSPFAGPGSTGNQTWGHPVRFPEPVSRDRFISWKVGVIRGLDVSSPRAFLGLARPGLGGRDIRLQGNSPPEMQSGPACEASGPGSRSAQELDLLEVLAHVLDPVLFELLHVDATPGRRHRLLPDLVLYLTAQVRLGGTRGDGDVDIRCVIRILTGFAISTGFAIFAGLACLIALAIFGVLAFALTLAQGLFALALVFLVALSLIGLNVFLAEGLDVVRDDGPVLLFPHLGGHVAQGALAQEVDQRPGLRVTRDVFRSPGLAIPRGCS